MKHLNGVTVLSSSQKQMVRLGNALHLARLNKVLLRPIHRGLTLKDILPRPAVVKDLMLIDTSSG